ncbi:hypothetical protein HYY72_00700 [Candidatus Woesearchaeota archaeon]|nr:hypothetical protein [Candidatus Woesearchaeota archaeon]
MDSCEECNKNEDRHTKANYGNAGKAGLKDYLIISVLAVLIIFSAVEAFQISAIRNGQPAAQAGQNSGGETYEQMMARMHPDQAAASNGNTMVGGC